MTNKIITIGRLSGDPEVRDVNGRNCVNFGFASDTRQKAADGSKQTNWYSVTAWGALGENMAKYLHKGDMIQLIGDLLIRTYKDKNGVDRTAVQITATDCEFLNTKRPSDNAGSDNRSPF